MANYAIPPDYSLREVYLMWLIANNTQEFATENGLNYQQLFAFRTIEHCTWKDFVKHRTSL